MRVLVLSFLVAILASAVGFAGPLEQDSHRFELVEGSMADLENGAYLEGSFRQGGIQPDYIIDLDAESWAPLLNYSAELKSSNLEFWEKVQRVVTFIKTNVFRYKNYQDPRYLSLNKKYREMNANVPVSEYINCGAGVCREHAIITHFALKAAGIPNLHFYSKVRWGKRVEDHAFVVLEHDGKKWIVDPYNWGFNGFLLEDMLNPSRKNRFKEMAPFAVADILNDPPQILEVNAFPKMWKKAQPSCSRVYIQ